MLPLANAIKNQRAELKLSLRQLAREVGCAPSYLSAIENMKLSNPPSEKVLCALEEALGFEDGYLVQIAQWFGLPTGVRKTLGALVQQFDKRARRADGSIDLDYLHTAGYFQSSEEDTPLENIQQHSDGMSNVPVINKIVAGYPTEFTDLDYPTRIADEYIPVPPNPDPHLFAARVAGQSMSPVYMESDIVVFSPAVDPVDGMDCFVRLLPNHETTFKRVYFEDNMVRLTPLNEDFTACVVLSSEVAGIYPAIQVIRPIVQPISDTPPLP